MVRIVIHTSRDQPLDHNRVMQQLLPIPQDQDVVIDMDFEGPSIEHIGLRQILDNWVQVSGRAKSSVKIHTPNQIENLEYEFFETIPLSHFFKKELIRYRKDYSTLDRSKKLFGMFFGNYTADRNTIAQTILKKYQAHSVVSIMRHDRFNAVNWWSPEVFDIGSIDNAWIKHQYDPLYNPNQSLLTYYDTFQIELVAETFTRGQTFFPTEKTVRPIMGSKPLLIFGPANFLKNLQQIGFKTFDKLWSEAYDSYEGVQRWQQMQLIIDHIVCNGYDLDLAQQATQHNWNRLQEIIELNTL